jgi:undecaprenyl diphosphate synthase
MSLPNHVALIPDGNRRWAKKQGLRGFMGHKEGAKTTETVLDTLLEQDVLSVTFWGCSVDNVVKREREEVAFLFELFGDYFTKLLHNKILYEREVRVRALGLWKSYFPESVQKAIVAVEEATRKHTKANLSFLLAYSGIEEMVQAVQTISDESQGTVTSESIKQHLYTKDLPPVDLVIRTGGEPHFSSGFMMWDVADAYLYFTETLWPDFSSEECTQALEEFSSRERRKGK